jgi:hypothetical protein
VVGGSRELVRFWCVKRRARISRYEAPASTAQARSRRGADSAQGGRRAVAGARFRLRRLGKRPAVMWRPHRAIASCGGLGVVAARFERSLGRSIRLVRSGKSGLFGTCRGSAHSRQQRRRCPATPLQQSLEAAFFTISNPDDARFESGCQTAPREQSVSAQESAFWARRRRRQPAGCYYLPVYLTK